jgi:hypothetical protein
VTRRALKLGVRTADYVEVTEGIAAAEVVVRAGHQKLHEGATVQPVQSPANP